MLREEDIKKSTMKSLFADLIVPTRNKIKLTLDGNKQKIVSG